MTAYFVTATGTDIGKTFVAAGLVRALRHSGREASALKPVISGFDEARAHESDSGILLSALGEEVTAQAIAGISPWRFAQPLSPDMAASREGRAIDFDQLIDFCRTAVAGAASGTLLIEGVGGVMVPLNSDHTVLDWMKALGLPVLLVAGTYLGTISHTLTALHALETGGIDVAALVLNESEKSPVPPQKTSAALSRFAAVPIHIVPRGAASEESFRALAKRL